MLKINTYSVKGIKTGDFNLPKEFDIKANLSLLAQAIRVYEDNSHPGLRKTKTRAEINRTGKKVYKQKGTGGARHGSRRANLFVGGGVALGPRPIRRILELPAKLKVQAKFLAFAAKAEDKKLVLVEGLTKVEKTKVVGELTTKLMEESKSKKCTFVISGKSEGLARSLRNLGDASVVSFKDVNALDIFKGGLVILDGDIFEAKKAVKKVTQK